MPPAMSKERYREAVGPEVSDEELDRLVEALLPLAEIAIDIAVARLATARKQAPAPDRSRLISAEEAAKMAGVTVAQFYRRVAFKPAIVKLGHRTVRVNESRLRKILESR